MASIPGEVHILPFPYPIESFPGGGIPAPQPLPLPIEGRPIPIGDGGNVGSPPATTPGSPGGIQFIGGTAGDDVIIMRAGAIAFGGGGNDVFVLTAGEGEGPHRLGFINDFQDGDSLDLSQLGAGARILAREAPQHAWGAERVSIDYDGDGQEDGYLFVSAGRAPESEFLPMPMPTPVEGEFHILPVFDEGAAVSNLAGSTGPIALTGVSVGAALSNVALHWAEAWAA